MVPRGVLKRIDILLVFAVFALAGTGLLMLYSLSAPAAGEEGKVLFYQQSVWVLFAVGVMAGCLILDFRFWGQISWILYLVNIVLLIALLLFAEKTHGAGSWFQLGRVKVQPSEFAKLLFVVTFADFLARRERERDFRLLIPGVLHFLVPFGLILLQPDFGTALIFVFIFFGMMYAAGMDGLKLVATATGMVSAGLLCAPFIVKGYQMRRILAFLDPGDDARGGGYQLIQSKIAIGSGHIFGNGIFGGSQAALGFLPASRTDFMFATLCEKTGLLGGAVVLLLFAVLLYRMVRIASAAEHVFGTYIAVGVMTMIASQAAVNMAMTVGFFPVTGIPLPFVSYGGSSLITNFAAVGLVLNVCIRRRKIGFM
ncbi:MAG: rod shape-determining protein RodA [bacterium]